MIVLRLFRRLQILLSWEIQIDYGPGIGRKVNFIRIKTACRIKN